MQSPREFYKSIHPDYFSDSEIEEVSALDRSLLEYFLASITGRNQEMDFERFARRVCEKEICPNLVPTTGPTGGGDSKVDAETYPVSERLALNWFLGLGNEAASERWAFAFSAKKTWKSKVEEDIAKVVKTGRGYTKAFFVTNQSVKSSTKSKVEDTLSKLHGIDVRILDRNWILTRVFEGRHEDLAISELNVTGLKQSARQVGRADSERIAELETIERRVANGIAGKVPSQSLVDDALAAAGLARELERPRAEVEGLYMRAIRMANQFGNNRQRVESEYQWGWTLFWWLQDFDGTVGQYEAVAAAARGSENVYDHGQLCNLWTVVHAQCHSIGKKNELSDWLESNFQSLTEGLEELSLDKERPSTALEARKRLLMLKLQHGIPNGESTDPIFIGLKEVVEQAEGLVGFPFETIVKMVSELGETVEDDAFYSELYEKVIDVTSRRDGDSRAAKLLLDRGAQLMNQRRYAKAIAITGKALSRLYKHETRSEEVYALFLCGSAYERIGLPWASRASFLFGASVAVNDFWSYGDLTRGFAACVNRMKIQELRLGRVAHFLAWHELDLAIWSRLGSDDELPSSLANSNSDCDLLLARLLLHTPPSALGELAALPDTFTRLGLYTSAASLLFLLGHVALLTEMAQESGYNATDLAQRIWSLKADVNLSSNPWIGHGPFTMTTRVIGCNVKLQCPGDSYLIQIGEWILAAIEAFLATSAITRAYSHESEVNVELKFSDSNQNLVSFQTHELLGRPFYIIECRTSSEPAPSISDQQEISQQIREIAISIVGRVVLFKDMESDLKALLQEERAIDRSISFTGSFSALRNTLGAEPKLKVSDWIDPTVRTYDNLREEPWLPSIEPPHVSPRPKWAKEGEEPPEGFLDSEHLSHEDIETLSPIRVNLWNQAGWMGAAYMWSPDFSHPPILGIMFSDRESGREIFNSWRNDYGEVDAERRLSISVVRGISRSNPAHYRIVIGPNLTNVTYGKAVTLIQRVHTMTPKNTFNLDTFDKVFQLHGSYTLAPAFFINGQPEPDLKLALQCYNFVIKEAWEIGLNDHCCCGIREDDDVIVPEGVTDPPYKQVFNRRHD